MEVWELYLFLKPISVLSEKRGTRQPKGWCVPREIERQTRFYYSCAKLETASFKICPLKLPVRSKGKTSVR